MSVDQEMSSLEEENTRLRAELQVLRDRIAQGRQRQVKAGGLGLRLLLPALDRKRVVRNFVNLFRVTTAYAGPRESWPAREQVIEAAEQFGVSALRFAIRRRMFLFVFSLVALLVPVVQVYLVFQQNRLVDLQNELINIQADDIVSRGVTSDNLLTNELNGALLSGRDIGELNRMLNRVFSAEMGELMGGLDADASRTLYLKGTAGRAHLLLALAESLRRPQSEKTARPAELWRTVSDRQQGAFRAAIAEASRGRLFVTLRTPRAGFGADAKLEAECQRYLLGLSGVLRRGFAMALAAGGTDDFFAIVEPLFQRVSQLDGGGDKPLLPTFTQTFGEFLLDLTLEPRFGGPDPALPGDVDGALKKGFARLKSGLTAAGAKGVAWNRLRSLLGVPQ